MILKPRPFRKPRKGHWATKGLVGCWLFNEGSGDIVQDLSGNGVNGTLVNETFWSAEGLNADSVNDSVNFDASRLLSLINGYPFSVVFSARHHTLNNHSNCFILSDADARANSFFVLIDDNNHAQAFDYGEAEQLGWAVGSSTLAAGESFTITAVFEGLSSRKIYLNGVLDGTDTTTVTKTWANIDAANLFYLDRDVDAWYLAKDFRYLYIYNRALTASEIALLYREPFCMFERDPIELWSAATLGAAPTGMAGAMTTNTGYWGW